MRKIFLRLAEGLARKRGGRWLIVLLLLALAWEYLGRPWLKLRNPGLELPSIATEINACIALLGL